MKAYRSPRSGMVLVVVLVAGLMLAGAATALVMQASPPARAAPTHAPQVRALVRLLGVLRRPQTPADRSADPFAGAPGVTPVLSLQRLARTTSRGTKVYIVPLVKSSFPLPLSPHRGGLGLSLGGRGGGCCETARQVAEGKSYSGWMHPWSLVMVVPDGVSRISVALRAPPGRQSLIVSGGVRSNVAVVRLKYFKYNTMPGDDDRVTWYAPSGLALKTFRTFL